MALILYFHDNTMYSSDKNVNDVMISLNLEFAILSNWFYKNFPAGNYMFKVDNKDNRTRYKIYSKLTTKIPCSSVFLVNFE